MNNIFKLGKYIYNLRNAHLSESQNFRAKRYGLDRIAYRAGQIWQTFPIEIRDSISLKISKHKKYIVLQFAFMLLLEDLHLQIMINI